jgi:PAT family beta-lactamase induction signal transducer AmpG
VPDPLAEPSPLTHALTNDARKAQTIHPIIWAILVLPFGVAVGYLQVAAPYLLRLRGVDMAVIGALVFTANQPHSFKVLWAPILDIGWPRKNWYVLMVALTAVALAFTSFIPTDGTQRLGPFAALSVYLVILTVAQVTVATSSSAVLGIMAVVIPEADQARASGWQTAGNLAGTSVGGAAAVWLVSHTSQTLTAFALAGTCLASTIPIFWIQEPRLPKHPLLKSMWELLKDLWKTLISRSGWTGMLICLSPVGTGALLNLFSALALDYSSDPDTREKMVLYVTGVVGGIVSAFGALLGGYLAAKMNRRLAYVIFGVLTSLCALAMIVAPANPTAFTIGCLAYSFANGLCFAAFYAFVFEMVGKGQGAATKLALFISASNQAINYTAWLDGKAYDWGKAHWAAHAWGGRTGMLGMDAGTTFVGIAVLGVMMLVVKKLGVARSERAVTA